MPYKQLQRISGWLVLAVTHWLVLVVAQLFFANLCHSQSTNETTNPPGLPQTVEPDTDKQQAANNTGRVHQNTLEMKLVRISAGDFLMGSHESPEQLAKSSLKERRKPVENEYPLRRVSIERSFYIGATEVSVGQYRQFVDATAYRTQIEKSQIAEAATGVDFDQETTWRTPLSPETAALANHPVTMVSYHDAVKFCEWLSQEEGRTYRLPTDAEWEYAARAGTKTRYWNGNSSRKLAEIANIPDTRYRRKLAGTPAPTKTEPSADEGDDGFAIFTLVGSYPANPWGLHDVHGNAWEWCSVADLSSLKIDDTEDVAVIRGGCFY